jgi:Fe-S-cluster containining protein
MTKFDPVKLLPPLPRDYTYEEALEELDALYAQLPTVQCKGLCHDSCTVVPASELEHRRINATGKSISPRMSGRTVNSLRKARGADGPPRCPALGPLNNCTIYEDRPFICRVFGVALDLLCEHGCVAENVLPPGEARAVQAQIEQLSRHVTGVNADPAR